MNKRTARSIKYQARRLARPELNGNPQSNQPGSKKRPRGRPSLPTNGHVPPQQVRRSARLKTHQANRKDIEHTTREPTEHFSRKEKISQLRRGSRRTTKSTHDLQPCSSSHIVRTTKRPRDTEDEELTRQSVKRAKQDHAEEDEQRSDSSKHKFVEAWLDSINDKRSPEEVDPEPADIMPPIETCTAPTTLTKTSKNSVSPYDASFVRCLSERDIYINIKALPATLRQRVAVILNKSRSSSEIDERAAEEINSIARNLWNKSEEEIAGNLVPRLIPQTQLVEISDHRMRLTSGQQWNKIVPIPINPSLDGEKLPLSKPKPGRSFGYSAEAFTRDQLNSMGLLTDGKTGNYAMPSEDFYFPFFNLELKAHSGSRAIATNQATNAGAVVGHGLVELAKRAMRLTTLDYDEPQFFSVALDNEVFQMNVHWLIRDAASGEFSFHINTLSRSLLTEDTASIRTIQREIKNIIDWGLGKRLSTICGQLDSYREERRKLVVADKIGAPPDISVALDDIPPALDDIPVASTEIPTAPADKPAALASETSSTKNKPSKVQKRKTRKRKTIANPTAPRRSTRQGTKEAA